MFFNWKLKKKTETKNIDIAYLSKRTPMWKPFLFLAPAIALILLFTILPAYMSFQRATVVLDNPNKAGGSSSFGWDHFETVVSHPYFTHSFGNSVIYAVIQIPIAVAISLTISAVISSVIRKRVRGGLQTLFFLPYVTSGIAVSMAFAYIFAPSASSDDSGLFNAIFGTDFNWLSTQDPSSRKPLSIMLVNGVWRAQAFQVLIFTTAMLGVDKDRYKAASLDGANSITQFFKITLPSIKRTLNFIITVGLIGSIKIFPLALFNNDPTVAMQNGGGTLMLYVYKAIQEGQFDIGAAASIILVAIAITFSITIKSGVKWIGIGYEKFKEEQVSRKVAKYKKEQRQLRGVK